MRFAIENGKPYMIFGERAYPVEIKDGTVKIDKNNASMTKLQGTLTLQEVIAKCGNSISSIPQKRRKKTEKEE